MKKLHNNRLSVKLFFEVPFSENDHNIPNKEDQHYFKEAYCDLTGQPSLVLCVDSLSSF